MNPGTLDRKIIIQRQADGLPIVDSLGSVMVDSEGKTMYTGSRKGRFGAELDSWGLWKTRFASKTTQRGSESSDNGREIGRSGERFRIRYTPGLTRKDRILHDSLAYDIVNIIEIERRKLQDIECVLHGDTRPE